MNLARAGHDALGRLRPVFVTARGHVARRVARDAIHPGQAPPETAHAHRVALEEGSSDAAANAAVSREH